MYFALPDKAREAAPEYKKKITIRAQDLEMEEKLWALAQLCDCSDIPGLQSNHEEADTWLLLHEKWALENAATRIVIQLPDTDVLVISTSHFHSLLCEELWFQTGIKDQLWFVPVHKVSEELGEQMCSALFWFHALTGCDSTSSLVRIGKKTG